MVDETEPLIGNGSPIDERSGPSAGTGPVAGSGSGSGTSPDDGSGPAAAHSAAASPGSTRNDPITVGSLIQAMDGYRARSHESDMDGELSVWLELTVQGEIRTADSMKVWWAEYASVVSRGVQARMLAFWEGIARFLNTGGNLEDVLNTLRVASTNLPTLDWSEHDVVLMATLQDMADDQPQHMFVKTATGEVIVWTEDMFIEVQSLSELDEEYSDYGGKDGAD